MGTTPPFVKAFSKLLAIDILLVIIFPFLIYAGPLGLLCILWLLMGAPLFYGTLVSPAVQWVSEETRSDWKSCLTKLQVGGGLWFLIWATVFHCLVSDDNELWEIYVLIFTFLQLFRLVWFAYLNIIAVILIPFFGTRLDKLCQLAAALSSCAGLYLWQLKGQLPPLPENSEQVPFFVILAVGSLAYGLGMGGAIYWMISYFRPPTETQSV